MKANAFRLALVALLVLDCLAEPPRSPDAIWEFASQRDAKQRLTERPERLPVFAVVLGVRSSSSNLAELPLFKTLLPSLVKYVDSGVAYRLYVVYDEDDATLAKHKSMLAAMIEQHFTAPLRARQFDVSAVAIAAPNPEHKPGPAFNLAAFCAYQDGADYFYRLNDDTEILEPFARQAIALLAAMQPPNVGVVGPYCQDCNNRILIHDIVHRTHIDIFNFYYPGELTDWWLDDWISQVYSPDRIVHADFKVAHRRVHQRYAKTPSNKAMLGSLIEDGRLEISRYLSRHGVPSNSTGTSRAQSASTLHVYTESQPAVRYFTADIVPPTPCSVDSDSDSDTDDVAVDEAQLVACHGACPASVSQCFLGACVCAPDRLGDACARKVHRNSDQCSGADGWPSGCSDGGQHCAPLHCFVSAVHGLAVVRHDSSGHALAERLTDHAAYFGEYKRVTALGDVLELAGGPWTQLRALLWKRPELDSSVVSYTLAEPHAAHYRERFETCAYRTDKLRAHDRDSYHDFPMTVSDDASLLSALLVARYDTVIAVGAAALTHNVFDYLTAVYRAIRPGGQLIWHELAYDAADIVVNGTVSAPRPTPVVFDWFLSRFHIVASHCLRPSGDVYVIARKK